MTLAVPSQPRGRIYLLKDKNQVTRLEAMPYDSEDFLQGLLEDHPELLAGEQINPDEPRRWLLVTREMGVPDEEGGNRWSIDHLFLDQDGMPTLVEVKRSSDTRIRREVVGQMLDYAANATVHWPARRIRSAFEARCEKREDKPDEALRRSLGPKVDTEEFWRQVEANLQAKRIRMLFVADSIPSELRRIVEFLNASMNRAEVLAVEIRQFASKGVKALVPRVIGQTGLMPPESISEQEFLNRLSEQVGDGGDTEEAARKLLDWSKRANLTLDFKRKVRGSRVLIGMKTESGWVNPLSFWDAGHAWLQMAFLKEYPPFDQQEKRQELHDKLKETKGFVLGPKGMEGDPKIDLPKVARANQVDDFLNALGWVVEQLRPVK